jgi:phospholipid/cholesterol/gamma-HCH transport system substrate-binding protein
MRRRRPRVSHLTAGLLALGLAVVVCFFAFGGSLPHGEHTFRGVFANSANLRPGAPVRIAGVDVGKVASVEPVGRGESAALVTMRMDDRGLPVHRDARMTIRPRLFLEGNFFVDLRPGTPDAPPLNDGATVPVNQTATAVQLGQVLEALRSDTRADLQSTLRELATGLERGGAAAFNRSLRSWGPAFRDGAIAAAAARGVEAGDLPRLFGRGADVAAALDEDPAALRSLVADLDTTAAAFARRHDELAQTLGELPRTLRAAYPALGALRDAMPPARAFAKDARPGVRQAGPALSTAAPLLRELAALTSPRELGGLTRDLAPAIPPAARLTRDAVPALRSARAAASCSNEVVLPVLNDRIQDPAFPATGPVYEELPKGLPGVAGESRSGDANGQWIRVLFGAGNYAYPMGADRFLLTTAPLQGVNPPKPATRPPLRADVPCETQERPDLRTIAGPPPAGLEVDTTSPAALAVQGAAAASAARFVRKVIRRDGLEHVFTVTDRPLRRDEIPLLRRTAPRP